MEQTQVNGDVVITVLSDDVARLSKEKALIQAQLYETQQLAAKLQQELEEAKKELEALKKANEPKKPSK